jgi:hypothetical protein
MHINLYVFCFYATIAELNRELRVCILQNLKYFLSIYLQNNFAKPYYWKNIIIYYGLKVCFQTHVEI